MNPNIPTLCNGCGKPLLLEHLFADDGCPCNTPRGVNFKPLPCTQCKVDNCIRPGHRIEALFGAACIAVQRTPHPENEGEKR